MIALRFDTLSTVTPQTLSDVVVGTGAGAGGGVVVVVGVGAGAGAGAGFGTIVAPLLLDDEPLLLDDVAPPLLLDDVELLLLLEGAAASMAVAPESLAPASRRLPLNPRE